MTDTAPSLTDPPAGAVANGGAPATLGWWAAGEAFFAHALDRLAGPDLDGPSLLSGWSRRTVIAHVARNADALANLMTWARSGVETPMYASPEARDAAIAETSALTPADLVADCHSAARRLGEAVRALPEVAWSAPVRTAQGRTVTAAQVPWMRCREVWVHAVDLRSGPGFADVPPSVLRVLVADVLAMWERRGTHPDITLASGVDRWGTGAVAVSGPLPDLAGWVTGRGGGAAMRTEGRLPDLPPWL